MRPIIRLNCENCEKEVDLWGKDLIIAEALSLLNSSFIFVCVFCSTIQTKTLPARVVNALGKLGISVIRAYADVEEPAFQYQDVLDFSGMLQDGSWEEDLRKNL